MKYYSTLGIYKNSTGTNVFNPGTKTAVSYNWWVFCDTIKGKTVFNNYLYSPSTSKHQSEVLSLLNYQYDLMVFAPDGLQNLSSAIDFERQKIRSLIKQIKKPRSHKAKNEERRAEIKTRLNRIREIKTLLA